MAEAREGYAEPLWVMTRSAWTQCAANHVKRPLEVSGHAAVATGGFLWALWWFASSPWLAFKLGSDDHTDPNLLYP